MTHFYYMAGKKLLVADDSLTIQKVIRLALSNEGYEIQAVSDGNDAIEQISLFRPDMVLIDVSLPGRSAFEVKRWNNQQSDLSHVSFVLMSSAFEKLDEAQIEEVKFHGRLTKPFDPAHLRQVLASTVQHSVSSQPPMPQLPPSGFPPPIPQAALEENAEPTVSIVDFAPPPPLSMPPMPEMPSLPNLPTPPSLPPPALAQDLWEKETEITGSFSEVPPPPLPTPMPPAPPSPPPTPDFESKPDSDIRELTESTIKMSGLDDFQWSIQEPSLKPPTGLMDAGGSSFELKEDQNVLQAPPPYVNPPGMNMSTPADSYFNAPEGSGEIPLLPPAHPTLTEDKMEEIIRSQLSATLERLAQKMIPEIAEKVIKQEIHRMLSEKP